MAAAAQMAAAAEAAAASLDLHIYHILVSSAENTGAFNSGFESVNLHHPTWKSSAFKLNTSP
jgi:hypothetical protein